MSDGPSSLQRFGNHDTTVAVSRLAVIGVVPLFAALASWVGVTLVDLRANMAVLSAHIAQINSSIYRSSDAERDLRLRDQADQLMKSQIEYNTQRLAKIDTEFTQLKIEHFEIQRKLGLGPSSLGSGAH
jgi:hypothetical protein